LVDAGDFFLRRGEGLDRVPGARADFPGPLDGLPGSGREGYQAPFGLCGFPVDLCLLSVAVICRPPDLGFLPVQALGAAGQQSTGPLDARQHALLQVVDCDAYLLCSLIELVFALIKLALVPRPARAPVAPLAAVLPVAALGAAVLPLGFAGPAHRLAGFVGPALVFGVSRFAGCKLVMDVGN